MRAVRINPTADQVQTVGILIARNPAQLVALGSDFSVRVVAEFASGTARLNHFQQATYGVPLVLGQRAMLILVSNLPPQVVIAITPHSAIRQLLLNELTTLVPDQPLAAVIRIPDAAELSVSGVGVFGVIAVRISLTGDIALIVTLVLPNRVTTAYNPHEPVVMLVGRRRIVPGKQRNQPTGFVVLIRRHRPQRVLLDRQPAFFIVGFEVLRAVRIDPLHQPCALVVNVDFLAAIGVVYGDSAVVVPHIPRVHLRKAGPVADTPCSLARPFPLPEETRPTGQFPLQDHLLIVVAITFAFADSVGRFDQPPRIVILVGNNVLLSNPAEFPLHLIVDRNDVSTVIPQQQSLADMVIDPLNSSGIVSGNAQPVVIRVADRRQHTVAEMVEKRRLSQHQFIGQRAQINRRFRQAIGDGWPRGRGQGKRGAAVFVIGPHHRFAAHHQSLRQRMTPAKSQAAIQLHGTAAIQPRPGKRQHTFQRAVSEGQ